MSKYPNYKDSNVEWLGDIPEHWELKKFKYSARIQGGKDQKAVLDDNGDYPVYGSGGIFGYANQYLYDGESVLLGRKGTVDKPLYVHDKFWTVDTMYYTIVEKTTIPKWLYYSATLIHFDYYQYGSAVPSMTQEDLHNIYFSTPAKEEQLTIANYLDNATAKIDTLIEKQTQLIELLKEKRQAVISTAVTRGLDSTVVMKDSGVEWLGEVPEGWEVKKFKYLFEIRKRISGELGYNILSITQQGIKVKDIESGKGQLSSDYTKYQHVHKGDYAMNHMDLLTGFVDLSKYDGVTSPDYRVFSLIEKKADANYYLFLLQMGYINKIFYPLGQGSSQFGRWRLPTDAFKEFEAPFPPQEEQEKIAKYIEGSLNRFALLTEKTTKAIELLKEKRTALISAVVTGKIDVREIA